MLKFYSWTALAVVGLLSTLWGVAQGANPALKSRRPNIVLIISDDHGWTDYSFAGHPHIQTPNIDRLAAESLTFTRGYVPSSLCCPSLASIITGLYPHQHKITSNDPANLRGIPERDFRQSDDYQAGRETMCRQLEAVSTLPRILAEHGYVSLQTGKWWQGDYRRGGFTHGMTKGQRHGDDGLEIGRVTMQPIFDFIDEARRDKKPFFVWYAPMMPHDPHNPPERLLAKYKDVAPSIPIAKYWAMVEWFDETVGALLSHLDSAGLRNDTIVVYVTDNGWVTDRLTGRYAPKSKQSPYESGLRTPIMIRWPHQVTPQRSSSLAMSIDLVPTLLAALELPMPAELTGMNLLDEPTVAARKAIYGECFTHDAKNLNDPAASLRWRWMIEDDWKLIVPAPQNEPAATVELYNMAQDAAEETNLASQHTDRVEAMRAKLDAWWAGTTNASSQNPAR
jgi:uncharacterized sulfatase